MTHWKKLHSPDFLGAYSLEPGQEIVLTIRSVSAETVTGTDGKKDECMVIHFAEKVKPMVCNVTNSKAIEKVTGTPYIEQWAGHKIQLYADKVKAYGDVVEALRVRPFAPKEQQQIICTDCKKPIAAAGDKTPDFLANYTRKKYGVALCYTCAQARALADTNKAPTEQAAEPENK